jgi:hypothetical protein
MIKKLMLCLFKKLHKWIYNKYMWQDYLDLKKFHEICILGTDTESGHSISKYGNFWFQVYKSPLKQSAKKYSFQVNVKDLSNKNFSYILDDDFLENNK